MRDANYYPQFHAPTTLLPEQIERERQERSEATQRAIEARQKRDAERAEQRERQQQEQAATELETYRQDRQRAWIAATGSVAGFSEAWPGMRQKFAEERMSSAVEREAAVLRASGQYTL